MWEHDPSFLRDFITRNFAKDLRANISYPECKDILKNILAPRYLASIYTGTLTTYDTISRQETYFQLNIPRDLWALN